MPRQLTVANATKTGGVAQNSNHPDGKTFKPTPPAKSGEFGPSRDERKR